MFYYLKILFPDKAILHYEFKKKKDLKNKIKQIKKIEKNILYTIFKLEKIQL